MAQRFFGRACACALLSSTFAACSLGGAGSGPMSVGGPDADAGGSAADDAGTSSNEGGRNTAIAKGQGASASNAVPSMSPSGEDVEHGHGAGTTDTTDGTPPEETMASDTPSSFSGVATGDWDDNATYRQFLDYLAKPPPDVEPTDVSDRRFVVVRDRSGHALANCTVHVGDENGGSTTFKTLASGRAPLFPHAAGLTGTTYTVAATCAEGSATKEFSTHGEDDVLALTIDADHAANATKSIDLAFVLDTTGSMSEEIDAIKKTIDAVAQMLTPEASDVTARVGLVAYRDQGDEYVTKTFDFTPDLAAFRTKIASLEAYGGGDYPEAVSTGLAVAYSRLAWNDDAFARFAFLVGDAPPKEPDPEQHSYAAEMRRFHDRGIQVFTVSASGQNDTGQYAFRQIAQYTYATSMFVLRGGAGPASTGGGAPKTGCGGEQTDYSTGELHTLIVGKVKTQVALYDADPMAIPGLGQDVRPDACPDGGIVAPIGMVTP